MISKHLKLLPDRLSGVPDPPSPPSASADSEPPAWLLSSLSHEMVVRLVHRAGTTLPCIRPRDRANGSDL
jgi:hypothetical protein